MAICVYLVFTKSAVICVLDDLLVVYLVGPVVFVLKLQLLTMGLATYFNYPYPKNYLSGSVIVVLQYNVEVSVFYVVRYIHWH